MGLRRALALAILAAALAPGGARALPGSDVLCNGLTLAGSDPAPVPGGLGSEIDYSVPGIPSAAAFRAEATMGSGPPARGMLYTSATLAGFVVDEAPCASLAQVGNDLSLTFNAPSGLTLGVLVRVSLDIHGTLAMDVGAGSDPGQALGASGQIVVDDLGQGIPVSATLLPSGFSTFGFDPVVGDLSTTERKVYEIDGTYDLVLSFETNRIYKLGYLFSTQAGLFGTTASPVTAQLEADFRDTIELSIVPLDETITVSFVPEPFPSALSSAIALCVLAARAVRTNVRTRSAAEGGSVEG